MKKMFAMAAMLMALPVVAAEKAPDCANAVTTLALNQCAADEETHALAQMREYLEASMARHQQDLRVTKAITAAQASWETYRDHHCDSVYALWRDGSIRDLMALTCRTAITQQRTHDIWQQFLNAMDGSAPLLPEPKVVSETEL